MRATGAESSGLAARARRARAVRATGARRVPVSARVGVAVAVGLGFRGVVRGVSAPFLAPRRRRVVVRVAARPENALRWVTAVLRPEEPRRLRASVARTRHALLVFR